MLRQQQQQLQPLVIASGYRTHEVDSDAEGSARTSPVSSSPTSASPSSITEDKLPPIVPASRMSPGWRLCYVLCAYDWDAGDPDHMSFKKNEILSIVKQEESGWWAAMRGDRDKVGWIPSGFVIQLSDELASRLLEVNEEHRLSEYDAERPFSPVLVTGESSFFEVSSPDSPASKDVGWMRFVHSALKTPTISGKPSVGRESEGTQDIGSGRQDFARISQKSHPVLVRSYSDGNASLAHNLVPSADENRHPRPCPPSPSTPIPLPPGVSTTRPSNVPVPRTPITPTTPMDRRSLSRSRSDSAPSTLANSRNRRRPIMLSDHSSLSRLSFYIESDSTLDSVGTITTPDLYKSFPSMSEHPLPSRPSSDKVKQLTGDDDAQAFHNAKLAQASLPWYLRPKYGSDEITLEYDGSVRTGTVPALVDRLTADWLKLSTEVAFRRTLLTTFSAVATADTVFELLVATYEMKHPYGLSPDEQQEWKDKRLWPVQKRVLSILSIWIEEHAMLKDDPHLLSPLRGFLTSITAPASLVLTAKLMLQSLERLDVAPAPQMLPSVIAGKRRKNPKHTHKNDLLRIDPGDLAQQLTLYEHSLYVKIRPRECLKWAMSQKGETLNYLSNFCSTHDKVAFWVKSSILINDGLGRRADTVEYWIKVAEKCRSMNNLASMSAISAALTSPDINKLHLTWAHVKGVQHLEQCARLFDITGNFFAYRTLLNGINHPCVPFIALFLTDLVHIHDQYQESTTSSQTKRPLVNFTKLQKWYEIINTMLRFQDKVYTIPEDSPVMGYVKIQLSQSSNKDPASLWQRSQVLQQNEVTSADIRKGLEAAGF